MLCRNAKPAPEESSGCQELRKTRSTPFAFSYSNWRSTCRLAESRRMVAMICEPRHSGLFANDDGAAFQVALDLPRGIGEVGYVIRTKQERLTMGAHELIAGFVSQRVRLQPIRDTSMRRWPRSGPAGREQDGLRRAHGALVREQHVIWTTAVTQMLVDVYDRLA
jgi:hypothetical protein